MVLYVSCLWIQFPMTWFGWIFTVWKFEYAYHHRQYSAVKQVFDIISVCLHFYRTTLCVTSIYPSDTFRYCVQMAEDIVKTFFLARYIYLVLDPKRRYRYPIRRGTPSAGTLNTRGVTEKSPFSEMTYTVSSGTLNSTIPYHTGISETVRGRPTVAMELNRSHRSVTLLFLLDPHSRVTCSTSLFDISCLYPWTAFAYTIEPFFLLLMFRDILCLVCFFITFCVFGFIRY